MCLGHLTKTRNYYCEDITCYLLPVIPSRKQNDYFLIIIPFSLQSESPTRKRRKVSQSVIDLTNDSPSPPVTSQHWENPSDRLRQSTRRRSSMSQRRVSNERCNTPRLRRRSVEVHSFGFPYWSKSINWTLII